MSLGCEAGAWHGEGGPVLETMEVGVMAVYTTFFLCKPKDLLGGFPGWKPPRARPVRREVRHPFTGETVVTQSREPDWPDDADDVEAPAPHVVSIMGRYED